jgi:hypothetical protein
MAQWLKEEMERDGSMVAPDGNSVVPGLNPSPSQSAANSINAEVSYRPEWRSIVDWTLRGGGGGKINKTQKDLGKKYPPSRYLYLSTFLICFFKCHVRCSFTNCQPHFSLISIVFTKYCIYSSPPRPQPHPSINNPPTTY